MNAHPQKAFEPNDVLFVGIVILISVEYSLNKLSGMFFIFTMNEFVNST